MAKSNSLGLLNQLREMPIKLSNTIDENGINRNVNQCPFTTGVSNCFKHHQEIFDFDSELRLDYRRCGAYKLAIKVEMGGLDY